ncbi:helix-turn-helix transcriptional regulator [Streptomyces sp. NPDC048290]|uniref:helix-turn-helix domain-containing protein n=1 Tax=Streptomyces sp. NPDC048290 TaxID=3155811 RepID=UPI00343567E0
MSALGDNVRNKRLAAGLTQEELAHAAGIAPSTVAKLEQGGSVRIETLHKLARALHLKTSDLMASGTPGALGGEPSAVGLVELRNALTPPVGLDDSRSEISETPDLTALREVIRQGASSYAALKLEPVAAHLPKIIRDSTSAVAHFDNGPESERALLLRSEALLLSGRYLTAVRQFDLAYCALSGAIRDALAVDDTDTASVSIGIMSWLMTRQGRFDDAERLAVETAERIEPRISQATSERLCSWGWLALHGAAAAVRNNRPEEAEEIRRIAASAASALSNQSVETACHGRSGRFDSTIVEMKALEDELIKKDGDPYKVIEKSTGKAFLSDHAMKLAKVPETDNEWNRHRLTVASAYVMVGDHDNAMDRLVAIEYKNADWLTHQRPALDIVRTVVQRRKRKLTRDMRRLSALLMVDA